MPMRRSGPEEAVAETIVRRPHPHNAVGDVLPSPNM